MCIDKSKPKKKLFLSVWFYECERSNLNKNWHRIEAMGKWIWRWIPSDNRFYYVKIEILLKTEAKEGSVDSSQSNFYFTQRTFGRLYCHIQRAKMLTTL